MPNDPNEGKAELVMKAVTILGVAVLGVVGAVCVAMVWRGDMTPPLIHERSGSGVT